MWQWVVLSLHVCLCKSVCLPYSLGAHWCCGWLMCTGFFPSWHLIMGSISPLLSPWLTGVVTNGPAGRREAAPEGEERWQRMKTKNASVLPVMLPALPRLVFFDLCHSDCWMCVCATFQAGVHPSGVALCPTLVPLVFRDLIFAKRLLQFCYDLKRVWFWSISGIFHSNGALHCHNKTWRLFLGFGFLLTAVQLIVFINSDCSW